MRSPGAVGRWLGCAVLAAMALTAVQVSAIFQQPPAAVAPALPPEPLPPAAEAKMADRIERRLQSNPEDLEATLLRSLLCFKAGDLGLALDILDELTRKAPNFQLAHLVRGDLLLAQFRPLKNIGQDGLVATLASDGAQQVERLREEALARLQGYLFLLDDEKVPENLINLNADTKWALVVDKSRNRLYLFENPAPDHPPRLIADYYCVFGKVPGNKEQRGDLKTPEGIYVLTGHIPGEKLPDRYGQEAYPLDYPNEYDRRLGKTGSGIWLHGTDLDYYSRPPQDSDGCIVLANDDLAALGAYVQPGQTPVVISDQLNWISATEWRSRRENLIGVLEKWRRDWEQDIESYLQHYSQEFRSDDLDLAAWRRKKERLALAKGFPEVRLDNLALYGYPANASSGRSMVVADFRQWYRSDTFSSRLDKRLYLVQEDRGWRIFYEGQR